MMGMGPDRGWDVERSPGGGNFSPNVFANFVVVEQVFVVFTQVEA